MESSTDIPFGPIAFTLSIYCAAFCSALALRKGLPERFWAVFGLLCSVFAVFGVLCVPSRRNGENEEDKAAGAPGYVALIAVSATLPLVLFAHLVRLAQTHLQQIERFERFANGGIGGLLLLLFVSTLLLLAFPVESGPKRDPSKVGRGIAVLALAACLLVPAFRPGRENWRCVRCGRCKQVRYAGLSRTCTHDWGPAGPREHSIRRHKKRLLQALDRLPEDAAALRKP